MECACTYVLLHSAVQCKGDITIAMNFNFENTAHAAGQVNATSSDEHYDYFNYMDNSVGGGGGGDVDDSAAHASSSSHFDYVLPKLDQLTAPTDTLIRD